MASPADYMKSEDDDSDARLSEHIPVEMPCEIVETSAVDQNGRQVLMAPVHGLVKNENNAMLQMHAGHHNHHHHQHHHHNHQDMEDGQLTYVYESVVPQELYAEPESPGPSR